MDPWEENMERASPKRLASAPPTTRQSRVVAGRRVSLWGWESLNIGKDSTITFKEGGEETNSNLFRDLRFQGGP